MSRRRAEKKHLTSVPSVLQYVRRRHRGRWQPREGRKKRRVSLLSAVVRKFGNVFWMFPHAANSTGAPVVRDILSKSLARSCLLKLQSKGRARPS